MSDPTNFRRWCASLFLLTVFFASTAASADNWPQWRGPEGNGHSREQKVPTTWSTTENVRWKVSLPGPGMSTPIVWGDKVFLTQSQDAEGKRRALLCLDRRSGKTLWERVTEFSGKEATYDGEKHYCSASPVTDGENVVAFFASAGIVCYDLNGKQIWRKDLGACEQIWGTASSPIIYKNLVIHNFGPGERTFLIALNKKTGEQVWKIDMPGKFGTAQPDWMGSWSTPVISKGAKGDELFMSWPDEIRAYEPMTGKQLWSCKGLGKLVYTSPLVTQDHVVVMSGFGGPAVAVNRGGSADVTDSHRLWRNEKSTQRIGSGIMLGDHVYQLNENGILQCFEIKSGKEVFAERATRTTWSSLILAGGNLYATNQQGETVVIKAKPAFEIVARNALNERVQSSIAVSNGDLFIRTYNHLWCIGAQK